MNFIFLAYSSFHL